ncbi:Proline--tRNA ligase [Trichinella spiralis]|uniref:Proline--tRNA ligase n=1 Tax=Trichinella spiralis TaxID=6334 RepID=A0ABR3K0V5_TRISP
MERFGGSNLVLQFYFEKKIRHLTESYRGIMQMKMKVMKNEKGRRLSIFVVRRPAFGLLVVCQFLIGQLVDWGGVIWKQLVRAGVVGPLQPGVALWTAMPPRSVMHKATVEQLNRAEQEVSSAGTHFVHFAPDKFTLLVFFIIAQLQNLNQA